LRLKVAKRCSPPYQGVREAAVFMATGGAGIEVVWAAIVCSETADPEALRAHCRQLVPRVFVPAHVVVVDALPVNVTGKVDRPRLKGLLDNISRS
jgi:long-chain acyl-CoA synthetase